MGEVTFLTKAIKPESSEAALKLGAQLLSFSTNLESIEAPDAVLNGLHAITSPALKLNALCAVRFPVNVSDWAAIRPGRNAFLHKNAPKDWWEEWLQRAPNRNPIGYHMARISLAPHTWSEMMRVIAPIGGDRWGIELAMKYGMRDGFMCPIGGRWLVAFWSPRVLTEILTEPLRIMIFSAASFAAMRLEQLVEADPETADAYTRLTPRELAVVRLLSLGNSPREIGETLSLGEETVRTHRKNLKAKLGARSLAHAVAEAMRQRLII
jgi:DNA-binding CsgD family transcriptional regulator